MHKLQADCRAVLPDKRSSTYRHVMAKRLATTGCGILFNARSGLFFVIASASEAISLLAELKASK